VQGLLTLVIQTCGSCSFLFNNNGFGYQNEKRKSTSPSAIQVKSRWKTISIEKLDVISRLEKVNVWLTYATMLDSLMVAYLQFVEMMIELENVLSQEIKCLCGKTATVLSESKVPKLSMCVSYVFIAL